MTAQKEKFDSKICDMRAGQAKNVIYQEFVKKIILVPIPDVDRGRCEYPNLKAIVLESHPEGHLWKLGCKTGVLDQWYSRNQFQPTLEKFMSVSDVSLETEVSLRTAAKQESMGGGQGYFKCNCTGNCQTKRQCEVLP